MSGWDWIPVIAAVGSAVSGIGAAVAAFLIWRENGRERRERETLTDGEWDILRAIVQTRLRRPYRLIVFDDTDVCRKYLEDHYPLKSSSHDYSSINAVPAKHANGPFFETDYLVIHAYYSRYVAKLVERRCLEKMCDNEHNRSCSYMIHLDWEPFIKKHSGGRGKLDKPFANPSTFADVSEMLTIDHNIWHELPINAMLPDCVDTSEGPIYGIEFPQKDGSIESRMLFSYVLQVPKKAVVVEELNRKIGDVLGKVTWNCKPYHYDVKEGSTYECLLHWREYGERIHLWFGVGLEEGTRKQIKAEFYPEGELKLPNSVYGQRREQRRHDRKMFRLRDLHGWEISWKHPVIYRALQQPLGKWLLDRWIDRKIKKENSGE